MSKLVLVIHLASVMSQSTTNEYCWPCKTTMPCIDKSRMYSCTMNRTKNDPPCFPCKEMNGRCFMQVKDNKYINCSNVNYYKRVIVTTNILPTTKDSPCRPCNYTQLMNNCNSLYKIQNGKICCPCVMRQGQCLNENTNEVCNKTLYKKRTELQTTTMTSSGSQLVPRCIELFIYVLIISYY